MWGRKLYYIDSYGKVQRDRKAERAAAARPGGGPSFMRLVWTVLIVLAVLMVLASLHH
jgi:hypothetical protein